MISGENSIDLRNATYTIGGRTITLVEGRAEAEAAPGSVSKITTRYFGNEAHGDMNGDGLEDVAVLLTQEGGGSGTFYYVVAMLQLPVETMGYRSTNEVVLGDRIAPQTTELRDGLLIVNYADRAPGEPMTARPSVGVSKYLKVENERLVETSGRL